MTIWQSAMELWEHYVCIDWHRLTESAMEGRKADLSKGAFTFWAIGLASHSGIINQAGTKIWTLDRETYLYSNAFSRCILVNLSCKSNAQIT